MMTYDVKAVAADMLLDTEDLREIYDIFFDDAQRLLESCETAIKQQDYSVVARDAHSLKGASKNLRMQEVAAIALSLEHSAKTANGTELGQAILGLKVALAALEEGVYAFYKS